MKGYWTCQRRADGIRCGSLNPNRNQKCKTCGKRRPARKRPAHMSALDLPYEYFAAVNGGEHCGVCGVRASATRKLDRDHSHEGLGFARGLLCHRHNRALKAFNDDPLLLAAAIAYLARAEARRPAA